MTRPWVVDDAVVPRPVVTATLAGDHRVSDGHRGAAFLAALDALLADPGGPVTDPKIRETVLRCLTEIAPDADASRLAPDADLRDELDLDSMDFLRFVQALHRETGVEIAEADYRSVRTLAGLTAHLRRAQGG